MSNPMSADELEFVRAIEEFKKQKSKTFLSWTEVLSVVKELGYRKSEQNRKNKKKAPAKKTPAKQAATKQAAEEQAPATQAAEKPAPAKTVAKQKG